MRLNNRLTQETASLLVILQQILDSRANIVIGTYTRQKGASFRWRPLYDFIKQSFRALPLVRRDLHTTVSTLHITKLLHSSTLVSRSWKRLPRLLPLRRSSSHRSSAVQRCE